MICQERSAGNARALTRIFFIWPHDSNSTIRELVACPRQVQFWHVAGHAFACRHPAGFCPRLPANFVPGSQPQEYLVTAVFPSVLRRRSPAGSNVSSEITAP